MFHSPYLHVPLDLAGFLTSTLLFRSEQRRLGVHASVQEEGGYWVCLGGGALVGAFAFGSLNLSLAGLWRAGHSIAGALVGAITAVEIYKRWRGFKGSTGAVFVLPLLMGVAIGRIGCFAAGLEDETFGTPTPSWLGIDLGDGIPRHPVQLYESGALVLGVLGLLFWRKPRAREYRERAFYLFVAFYALQRFAWEFLKPYPTILGSLNIFHFVCLALFVYALAMLKGAHAHRNP